MQKRRLLKQAGCVVLAGMLLFTGCGNTGEKNPKGDSEVTAEAETAAETEAETAAETAAEEPETVSEKETETEDNN